MSDRFFSISNISNVFMLIRMIVVIFLMVLFFVMGFSLVVVGVGVERNN